MVSQSVAYDYMCYCFDSCHVVERDGEGRERERDVLRSSRLEYNASTINFLLVVFFFPLIFLFFSKCESIGSKQLFTIKNSLHNDNQISSY